MRYTPQTAGTGSLADRPIIRAVVEDRVFFDKFDNIYECTKKRQELEDLPVRRSDVTIVERGRALNVPTFILMSPLIYGASSGYFNQLSIQIPYRVRAAVKAKSVEMVADGNARWANIHIECKQVKQECCTKTSPFGPSRPSVLYQVILTNIRI